ncbi:MAG: hypothetical protein K9N55_16960 [Phycisphaerae bacterium]|nr:hypothetical protein [Phycisphaerae bacterium]
MKTTKQGHLIKTTCILLLCLTSVSMAKSYPPDNAAVLYYKAFLMFREPSQEVKDMMRDLREGKIEPNDQIKEYLDENKYVIEFVETAANIRECDWGHDLSRGLGVLMPELLKVRLTAFMLCAKAQILAEDGEYKAALNQCLTIHKMARHVSDSLLISYLVSASLNDLANNRIRDLLSSMPQNLDTLTWLKGQMVSIAVNAPSLKKALAVEKTISESEIREEKIDSLLEAMGDDFVKDEITADALKKVKAGDAGFFKDNRAYYANIMDDVIAAVELPYPEAHKRLKTLQERTEKEAKTNSAAIMAALLSPASSRVCTIGVKSDTFFNAIRAAIDITMVKARTGRLPNTLPDDLPRDLFSGKDFLYEKSPDGFVLRCQAKDLDKDEIYQYEFRAPK